MERLFRRQLRRASVLLAAAGRCCNTIARFAAIAALRSGGCAVCRFHPIGCISTAAAQRTPIIRGYGSSFAIGAAYSAVLAGSAGRFRFAAGCI